MKQSQHGICQSTTLTLTVSIDHYYALVETGWNTLDCNVVVEMGNKTHIKIFVSVMGLWGRVFW